MRKITLQNKQRQATFCCQPKPPNNNITQQFQYMRDHEIREHFTEVINTVPHGIDLVERGSLHEWCNETERERECELRKDTLEEADDQTKVLTKGSFTRKGTNNSVRGESCTQLSLRLAVKCFQEVWKNL